MLSMIMNTAGQPRSQEFVYNCLAVVKEKVGFLDFKLIEKNVAFNFKPH